jgi:nucleoid DNA-binding protein
MNHRQTIQAIARRLPHLQRHDVAEVLEVAAEVWSQELAAPGGTVTLVDMGKLEVEAQQMRVGGAIREKLEEQPGSAPETIQRLYFRFRPSGWLREKVKKGYETTQET